MAPITLGKFIRCMKSWAVVFNSCDVEGILISLTALIVAQDSSDIPQDVAHISLVCTWGTIIGNWVTYNTEECPSFSSLMFITEKSKVCMTSHGYLLVWIYTSIP